MTLKKHSQSETWLNLMRISMASCSNTRNKLFQSSKQSTTVEYSSVQPSHSDFNEIVWSIMSAPPLRKKPNLVSFTPRTKELRLENKTYFEGPLLKKAVRIYIAQLTCNDKQRETFEGRYTNAFSWCPSTQTLMWTFKNDNRIGERQYLPYSNVLRSTVEPSFETAC